MEQKNNLQWGIGPWNDEPADTIVHGEYKEYKYHLQRSQLGTWCGYVEVDPASPYALEDYDKIKLEVYGGVTYSEGGKYRKTGKETFFIGFDCAHSDDLIPGAEILKQAIIDSGDSKLKKLNELTQKLESTIPYLKKTYKTLEFATNECKSMIDQIILNPDMK